MCSTHLQVESLPRLVLVAPGMGPSRAWTTHLGMSKTKEATEGRRTRSKLAQIQLLRLQVFLGGGVPSCLTPALNGTLSGWLSDHCSGTIVGFCMLDLDLVVCARLGIQSCAHKRYLLLGCGVCIYPPHLGLVPGSSFSILAYNIFCGWIRAELKFCLIFGYQREVRQWKVQLL